MTPERKIQVIRALCRARESAEALGRNLREVEEIMVLSDKTSSETTNAIRIADDMNWLMNRMAIDVVEGGGA